MKDDNRPKKQSNIRHKARTARNTRAKEETNSSSSSSDIPRKTGKNKKKKRKKSLFKIFFICIFILMIIGAFVVGGALLGIYFRIIKSAPALDLISVKPSAYTSIVYDNKGGEIDRYHATENRQYVTLNEIPKYVQSAIVSVEDERFYKHNGIDIRGILRAGIVVVKNKITGQSGVEGASTITQQLIKNNITKVSKNSIETKLQEQYLAVKYEKAIEAQLGSKLATKEYILELYLNTIGLGHGYNGVQTASLGYFNKDAKDLTLAEAACIAGITNNPSLYSPRSNPDNNKKRQTRILNKMLEQGYITQQEFDTALAEDIYPKVSKNTQVLMDSNSSIHSYFSDAVFEEVSTDLQEKYNLSSAQANNLIYNGGLQIKSTQSSEIQKHVDEAYLNDELFPSAKYSLYVTYVVSVEDTTTGKQEHSEYKKHVKNKEEATTFIENTKKEIESKLSSTEKIIADRDNITVQPQSAMVVMENETGEVRAISGGRGKKAVNRGFNRATEAVRQPGSTFKILAAFAPAIDLEVVSPATVIIDEPYTIGDYSPSNWYKEYRGAVTIRSAIRDSMNIIAVKTMAQTGIEACYTYLKNFGFTTLENDNHLATALGGLTKGVTQLEITASYAAIANGGMYNSPSFYTEVLDHDGNVLLSNTENEKKQVIKETTAYLLTDMMKDVINGGTGRRAKMTNNKIPAAGKTGTTSDTKDLMFLGYTPYYTAGVWLGYDQYDNTVKNMSSLSTRSHLLVWKNVMEKIHKDLEYKDFKRPEGIISGTVCAISGKIPTESCTKTITDLFVQGTLPTEECNSHKTYKICSESNSLAGDFCPANKIVNYIPSVSPTENQINYDLNKICEIHLEGDISFDPSNNNMDEQGNNTVIPTVPTIENEINTEYTTKDPFLDTVIPNTPEIPIETTVEQVTSAKEPVIETNP